jgi:hypothetical protein
MKCYVVVRTAGIGLRKTMTVEAKNKHFKDWNRKLALENEELKNIREQCIDENKVLKKENKAYKGMWGELKIDILRVKSDYWETTFEDVLNNIKVYETKYLGGAK